MGLLHWQVESPKKGTYTIFNLTNYSSGESEATITTVKDTELRRQKVKVDDIQINKKDNLEIDQILEDLPLSELDKEENKMRSLRRTRSVIRKKIIEGELDHFLTLTYKENKTDLKECWKDWKKFIRLVQKKYPTLKYLVIVERQKRGAVHFHAAIHGFMHANTIRTLWKSVIGEGNIDLKYRKRNQSMHGLAKYITKYITKQYEELETFQNMYRCSKNILLKNIKFYLPKEFALYRLEEIEEMINQLIPNFKQNWEENNGLFNCRWVSTLSP